MMKKAVLIALALAVILALCGCAGGDAISVQRADQLAIAGKAGDRYAGMVVSENVVKIQRDSSKTVKELYVELGQDVQEGDKLFSYDAEALELDLEKAQLELEKMTTEQTEYAEQMEKLEKELARTYNEAAKVRLMLEINTLKTTQMENDYNLAAKEDEITKLQEMLENVDVTTPVDGVIRQIDEQGENGAYITIQQRGAYRIKGSVNEMSIGNGIMPGTRVIAYSRIDDRTWTGTVANIDTDGSAEQNNDEMYYYGAMDPMSSSSSYPFYVDLDSVDGLLLGQHVYMEILVEEQPMVGLWIPESFLLDMTMDEETYEMTAAVYADNGQGKLEKRTVVLGMYDDMTGCYEILTGLTPEDYLADPITPGCEAGASTVRREPEDFSGAEQNSQPEQTPTEEESADIMLPVATAPEGEIPADDVLEVPTEEIQDEETSAPTEG